MNNKEIYVGRITNVLGKTRTGSYVYTGIWDQLMKDGHIKVDKSLSNVIKGKE